MSNKVLRTMVVALGAGMLVSCVTRGDIDEIKKTQQEILAKLDKVGTAGRPNQPPRQPGPDQAKTYSFPVEGKAIKGADDAWVTVAIISEFQCPFCKRVEPTLQELEKKFGNDIRFVFNHNPLPFHNRAKPASMAAACAGEQGKFWPMHDKLFENQPKFEDPQLEEYAKAIGIDVNKWKSCYTSNKYDAQIQKEMKDASTFGARGTPAFFINGRFLSGAQPTAAFEALVNEELKKAKESKLSKKEYYSKAILEQGAKAL